MTTIDDLKATEARVREAEANALASLHDARTALETAGRDDREAYAAALAAGESPPKEASTPKLVAKIRDIEKRVLPAVDDALWRLAQDAREAIRGDIEVVAFRTMKRWASPHAVNDPSQPAATRHGEPRPADVVAWVAHMHELIVQAIAKADAERDREDRRKAATRAVARAQTEYDAAQQGLLNDELDSMSPGARLQRIQKLNAGESAPWRPFDRYAFLKREGLLEDYGYVQPGTVLQVQGGNRQEVEFVPRDQLQSPATEA
jgi:hypothetical protein